MPSLPRRVVQPVARFATTVVRRTLGIEQAPAGALTRVGDDLPRDQLFAQPLTCEVAPRPHGNDAGQPRAVFRVVVRDATGRRCADLAVEARVDGPTRSATGQVTTDLLGAALFRMADGAGTYTCEVLDVAALALAWDRAGSTTTATTSLP